MIRKLNRPFYLLIVLLFSLTLACQAATNPESILPISTVDAQAIVAQAVATVRARPGELRKAEWSEIDFEAGQWCIPAEKMKMGVAHIVPLSKQALAVLRELHPLTSKSRYIFPSVRSLRDPMSENTVNAALRRLGYGTDDMTGHGFRSMASTLLHEMGWTSDAIERQLAHAERNPIKAAYNRAEHLPERRRMMQAWADYLDKLRIGTGKAKLLAVV